MSIRPADAQILFVMICDLYIAFFVYAYFIKSQMWFEKATGSSTGSPPMRAA